MTPKPTEITSPLLTAKQVGEIIGISPRQVTRLAVTTSKRPRRNAEGKGDGFKKG